MSRIHGSTTRRSSFAVSDNVLQANLIQGEERLRRPAGLFGSLFPAGQITAQEAAAAVPHVLPVQRGYDIIPVDQYCKLYPLQEVGRLTFTTRQ